MMNFELIVDRKNCNVLEFKAFLNANVKFDEKDLTLS